MALRITSRGVLSIDYEVESEKWRSTLRPPRLRDLGRVVEFEPGLSLGMLFDVMAESPQMMEVIGEMCFVDVAALHARSRLDGEKLLRSDLQKVRSGPDTVVDELVLERELSIPDSLLSETPKVVDPDYTGERYFPGGLWLTYKLSANGREWRSPRPLGTTFESRAPTPACLETFVPFIEWLSFDWVFASVVHLPLRMRTEANCYIDERFRRVEIPWPWRFYEVLLATYGPFGQPPYYLDMGQAAMLESQEMDRMIQNLFEGRSYDPDPDPDPDPESDPESDPDPDPESDPESDTQES